MDNETTKNEAISAKLDSLVSREDEHTQKEIDRIKELARIYKNIQSLLPDYNSEYLQAYVDMANRFSTDTANRAIDEK